MATKYLSKANLSFQYVVDDTKPFYRALISQGYSEDVGAFLLDVDRPKTIFPGSDDSSSTPLY